MYDFAIIGSGVSGGRVAYELTQAGAKCVLLEAGREFGARTFPKNELDYSTQLFWGGGLEVSTDGHLGFLRARCLGGTSIVNQALLDRFDDLAWSDWRDRSGIDFLDIPPMERHYDACEATIQHQILEPELHNRNAKIFTKACERMGVQWHKLHRAQGDCKLDKGSDCIVCLGGCQRDSKQSSLVTGIRKARELGLEVISEFEVRELKDQKDSVRITGLKGDAATEIVASRAVLAAGSFGNVAILIRSGLAPSLPALGLNFSCHPQFMTYGIFDEIVDSHKGAFQTVKSQDMSLRKRGFKLENVFAGPIGTAMLVPGFGADHLRVMKKYRHLASMEVATRDEPMGRIYLGKCDRVRVDKPLTAQDRGRIEDGLRTVRELFEAAGAREVVQCRQGFGLHLMGGCVIGTDPLRSVVNPEFQVHGCSRLYAADSSIFPSAPGINPSFTIMALSHRAAESMLAHAGGRAREPKVVQRSAP